MDKPTALMVFGWYLLAVSAILGSLFQSKVVLVLMPAALVVMGLALLWRTR